MTSTAKIQPAEAARLLALRRDARRSLAAWSRLVGFEPAAHHQLIIDKLEAVVRGEVRRLAIFLPPGSAKSTYASVLFPPWFLAQRAGSCILAISHNKDLIQKFGRKCRNLVDEHKKVLGYELASDSSAADDWGTSNGSVYFCGGIGSKIAGHRADLGLIDDPIGSIVDADSLLMRDAAWDFYEWDFLPRLKPNAAVVVISTRWHEDDLMGRLLHKELGRWTVIKVPMEAGHNDPLGRLPGDRLWPEYFTDEMVVEAKSNSRKWMGAYQQEPAPEEGDYFKKEWIVGYEPANLPKSLTVYCASDHACSEKDASKNDPNLLVPFGVDEGDNVWIFPDIWWEVADTGKTVTAMIEMMRRRQPVMWAAETEHIVKSIGPFLNVRLREERIYTTRMCELPSRRDKVSKCRSIQGRMEMRKVFFPKFANWWPKAEHELLSFPVGVHDEFPDVLGVIGRFLESLTYHTPPERHERLPAWSMGWLKEQVRRNEAQERVENLGF
ncbi:MAG TPA: hypothetical protein VIV60_30555 [Polyangiaceae bacterium]